MPSQVSLQPPRTALDQWWRQHQRDDAGPATEDPDVAAELVAALVAAGLADLPLPGGGETWARLEALATLGELDLTVGRLVEAHSDALAILAELDDGQGTARSDGAVWGVWAAEPPTARVTAELGVDGQWRLTGRKAWCSGAGGCTQALATAHASDGPRLFAVDPRGHGVRVVADPWPAAALSGTDTRSVDLTAATARPVGGPRDYLDRPGFWHGAVGVAAVWYGGCVAVASALRRASSQRVFDDIDNLHLGAVDADLWAARSALQAAATAIDNDPGDEAGQAAVIALRTRAVVEATAAAVTETVARALGPSLLTRDGDHARRVADLALYVRQSHGDRDLADLGRRLSETSASW